MRNAEFHTHDVKKCCESKLGIKFKPGAEFNGWYTVDNRKAARITIPMGRKPIPPKTYKSMAKQLKLTIKEFDSLLECPLTRQDYDKIIRSFLNLA